MTLRIGWYVHHHGGGHLARMLSIARHLDAEITCFSSLPEPETLPAGCSWIVLERDDDVRAGITAPADADPTAGGLLHWAPLGHPGHLGRLAAIAATLSRSPWDAFVVDVSVEVAVLVRLLGIRTVVIAQPGRRDDVPHRLGYRAATTILAPWPRALLQPAHLDAMADKVVYTGGISRFEHRPRPQRTADGAERRDVVVLGGRGGSDVTDAAVAEAASATGLTWRNLGATPNAPWATDPWADLASAGIVVAWAGQNSIADLAVAGAVAVVIPQDRPFSEQLETAHAVERAGLAVVVTRWPSASAWPELIEDAAALHPDWSQWQVEGAAARAAEAIRATASPRP
jgi:hypothetical protein